MIKPYFETELGKLYCENCLRILLDMPDNYVDLTITSPPYGNLRQYKDYVFNFEGIANELYRITKKGGIVVWIVGDETINGSETGMSFKQSLFFKDIGFKLHDTMIYQKDSCPFPETNRYYPSFEYMFIFSKDKPKTVNLLKDKINIRYGDLVASSTQREANGKTKKVSAQKTNPNRMVKKIGTRTNIWLYSPGFMKSTSDVIAFEHPAIFPEKLAEDHILSWSDPGDLILDPMAGSGTVLKICELAKRKWIGIDISKEYCEIAKKRIEQTTKQKALFN